MARMVKKGYRIVFSADIHGNMEHYNKIFRYAENCSALIFAGDLCPKGAFTGSQDVQKEFLKTYLIPKLKEFRESGCRVYIMMGNDDWAGNYPLLKEEKNWKLLENGPFHLYDDIELIGYPYVPVTPFRMKDWEKWDLSIQNDVELQRQMLLHGITSWSQRYEGKWFHQDDRRDNIEKDIKELFSKSNPKKTIFAFHAPPFNTNLDMLHSRDHIGSLGIRMGIEKNQPPLTLHAHIHETVDVSGEFVDKIGDSVCAGVGSHFTAMNPHILVIELPSLEIRRIKLE